MPVRGGSLIAVAIAVGALLGVTGCSGSKQQALELPQKNRAEWVMPLDDYIPQFWHMVDYAESLAVTSCMADAGYEWKVPWQDQNGGRRVTMNATQRKLFNPNLAHERGYHSAPNDDPSFSAWRAFVEQTSTISEAEHDTLYSCTDSVHKKVLPEWPGSAQLPSTLEEGAYEAALQDPGVLKAARIWRQCMLPQGVSDLPASPDTMPSPSLRKQFGLDATTNDDSDLNSPSVTPEEITLAVADASCRESSGWAAKLYNAEWDRDVATISENADALAGIRRQVVEYRKKVFAVIADHAPAAP